MTEPEDNGNGQRGRRTTDPQNVFGLALALARQFGFPSLVAGAAMAFTWAMFDANRSDTKAMQSAFVEALAGNTAAVTGLASKQDQANDTLKEIKVGLDRRR